MSRCRLCAPIVAGLIAGLSAAAALADEGLARRGMFGFQLAPVTADNLAQTGLDKPQGVLVSSVFPDSPAAAAGVKGADVILAVDGAAVDTPAAFMAAAAKFRGGSEVPLTLSRAGEKLELRVKLAERPRESDDNFDVIYDFVRAGDLRQRTILTRPKTDVQHPALLYVGDVGAGSVDWFSPQVSPPAKTLLYLLTAKGMVTMRIESQGVGDSEGTPGQASDFAAHLPGIRAALKRLREYPFVDSQRIFVFGDRLGALAAAQVAAENPPAGIIAWASSGRMLVPSQLDLVRRTQKLGAFSDEQAQAAVANVEKLLTLMLIDGKSLAEVVEAHPDLAQPAAEGGITADTIAGRSMAFMRQLARTDPAAAWSKVRAPVLALYGGGDWTTCAADADAIVSAVKGGSGTATALELPGVDAFFSKVQDMEESFLAGQPGTFDPRVVEAVWKWISEQTNQRGGQ